MANIKDFIKKIGNSAVSIEEQQQALLEVEKTIAQAKQQREESVGKNADMVINALKTIEAKLESKLVELNNTPAKQGIQGPQGIQGRDGRDGKDGYNGKDGKDGIDGKDGKDGEDGISVADAQIDFDGSLLITLSDGREIDAGTVIPLDVAKQIHSVSTNGGGTSQPVLDALASLQAQIDSLGGGGVTSVTGTAPIVSSGGTTPAISIAKATTSVDGYLAATDFTTFNNKAANGANTDITSVALTTGTISTAPSSSTDIVNKSYADSISTGVNFHPAVNNATTTALPTNTYNNGVSGVGATLTAVANGALTIDGTLQTVGNRVLVKDEIITSRNGVYTVTQVGSGILPYILTRATDYDSSGSGTNEVDAGDMILVLNGTSNANTSWVQQTPLPITIGTTAIVFIEFAKVQTYTAGTGLTLSTNQFSITDTGTAGTYGSGTLIPVITTNAQGQVTSVTTAANPQGTVTSVAALTLGTSGTDLASTVANGTTTPVITLNVPTASATNRGALSSADWTTFNNKGSGTVTSVGFTGGIVSVGTATTTPAFTIAGTSGGIPYFSSGTTWATSAALAANALVIGGGAGVAPSTTTTGTGVLTALGTNTGTAGAFVVNGGALGTPSSGTVTNLTGTASININGTVGATTPTTGAFTTLDCTSTTNTSALARNAGQTANVTITNTTTYTTGGVTLATQSAATGSVWRVRAFGQYTAANSGTARTARVACFWGATQLTAITSTVLVSVAQTTQWQCEFTLTASSATAIWTTGTFLSRVGSATALAIDNATPASTTGLTTTSTLDLRFSMSSATPADSWIVQSVTMERLE